MKLHYARFVLLILEDVYLYVKNKKTVLLILDGWGLGKPDSSNAIYQANTPFFDYLMSNYPNAKLEASGEAVGLPAGQMGNSEVGHMNLGAGRIVYQELGRINKAVDDGSLNHQPVLQSAFDQGKKSKCCQSKFGGKGFHSCLFRRTRYGPEIGHWLH